MDVSCIGLVDGIPNITRAHLDLFENGEPIQSTDLSLSIYNYPLSILVADIAVWVLSMHVFLFSFKFFMLCDYIISIYIILCFILS